MGNGQWCMPCKVMHGSDLCRRMNGALGGGIATPLANGRARRGRVRHGRAPYSNPGWAQGVVPGVVLGVVPGDRQTTSKSSWGPWSVDGGLWGVGCEVGGGWHVMRICVYYFFVPG